MSKTYREIKKDKSIKLRFKKIIFYPLLFIFLTAFICEDIEKFKQYKIDTKGSYWDILELKRIPVLDDDYFDIKTKKAILESDMVFRKQNELKDLSKISEIQCSERPDDDYNDCFVNAYKQELISDLRVKRESISHVEYINEQLLDIWRFYLHGSNHYLSFAFIYSTILDIVIFILFIPYVIYKKTKSRKQ